MVLERWTQDRSVLHVRILRSAPQAPLPDLGQLPVLPSLPLSGGAGLPPVTTLPPALQAMLGVAAEAAAAEALKNDTTLPPLPTLSLLPELEPQQPAQQPQQQPAQPQQQPMQQEQSPDGGPAAAAAAAAGAPSAAASSRLVASGGNSASNLSEPMPPASADQADVPMQQPASDAAADT